MRLDGFISLASVTLPSGVVVPAVKAASIGLIEERLAPTDGWPKIGAGEIPVGTNLHTNGGRQNLVYCWANRAPITDFACSHFCLGTGSTPVTVDNTALDTPLAFYGGLQFKPVNSIDFPEPYIARVSLTIAAGEAQGVLITEMGLNSGNGTLLHRSVLDVPLNKGNVAKTYLWRLRF